MVPRQHGTRGRVHIWARRSAESALEPLPLPDRWAQNVPSREDVAERANQPGNVVPRDEVGILDPVHESGGSAEGGVAGRRFRMIVQERRIAGADARS